MNKKLGIIIGVVLVLVAVIAAVFLLKGNKEKEIPIVDISGTDIYKWANSGIDESSPAAVKADVEGHNMAKTAGKEEMGKG